MRADDLRRIALGMAGATESAHMGHPDFRVNGRIFATLHSDNRLGMVKLTPEQQQEFVADHPAMFVPESGAWGRQGCTRVVLASADVDTVGEAITLAWRNAVQAPKARASKKLPKKSARKASSSRKPRKK